MKLELSIDFKLSSKQFEKAMELIKARLDEGIKASVKAELDRRGIKKR